MSHPNKYRVFTHAALALLFALGGNAQERVPEPKQLQTITSLRSSIESVEAELVAKNEAAKNELDATGREALVAEIAKLKVRLASLNTELDSVVTGIDVATLKEALGESIDRSFVSGSLGRI